MEGRACDSSWPLDSFVAEEETPRTRGCGCCQESHSRICLLQNTSNSIRVMPRTLPASFAEAKMGFGQQNNNAFYNSTPDTRPHYTKRANYVALNDRLSTEWDIRLDLTNGLSIEDVVNSVVARKQEVLYCLVSGLEFGKSAVDRRLASGWMAEEEEPHVHICLVTMLPKKRQDALQFFRSNKIGGEYAKPRESKHTYLGWRLHHCKEQTKIGSKAPILEFGTLPMDPLNEETGMKIISMIKKYGDDDDKVQYKRYYDIGLVGLANRRKIKKRKAEDEVNELRAKLARLEELTKQNE